MKSAIRPKPRAMMSHSHKLVLFQGQAVNDEQQANIDIINHHAPTATIYICEHQACDYVRYANDIGSNKMYEPSCGIQK